MDLTIENARELVSDPVLWPRVRDLLWDFAPQIHPSWIESFSIPPSMLSSGRVKLWMLERLGVESCFHTFPKDDWSRLLLLDGSTLLDICKWLGAIACVDSLRHITSGKSVRELKVGLSGVYPEVFTYTAYFKGLNVEGFKVEGLESVIGIGWHLMKALVANVPEPLKSRLSLKLPQSCASFDLQPSILKPINIKHFNMQLLLKLRFPEAYRLCCS